jgi:hypothetical protein
MDNYRVYLPARVQRFKSNRTFLCIFNSGMLLQILGMGTLMVVPLEVTGLMMVILSSSIPIWLVDSMLR